jgi:hypothetical protein
MYAQMLVGMVSTTGQWWLDTRKPAKDIVAAHLCNLAWNGLSGLDPKPRLVTRPDGRQTPRPRHGELDAVNSPVSIGIARRSRSHSAAARVIVLGLRLPDLVHVDKVGVPSLIATE